jgi:hypothetical protein
MVRRGNRVYFDDSYTVAELKYVAKVEGVIGYSRLNKQQLLRLMNTFANENRRCNNHLSKEIAKNIRKFKNREEFTSKKQAIAVAYAKVKQKYGMCEGIYS